MTTKMMTHLFSLLLVGSVAMAGDPSSPEPVATRSARQEPQLVVRTDSVTVGTRPHLNRSNSKFVLNMRVNAGPGLGYLNLGSQWVPRMVRDIPADLPVSQEVRELLGSGGYLLGIMTRLDMGYPEDEHATDLNNVCFTAPTSEAARELADGFIAIYNACWPKHWKSYLESNIDELEKQAKDIVSQRENIQKQYDQDEASLKKLPLSPEITTQLMANQMMLQVELVGIRARIAAAERLSNESDKGKTAEAVHNQLESIRLMAQVELAGALAKQEGIDSTLKIPNRVRDESQKLFELSSQMTEIQKNIKQLRSAIESAHFDTNLETMRMAEGTISPIEWYGEDVNKGQKFPRRREEDDEPRRQTTR